MLLLLQTDCNIYTTLREDCVIPSTYGVFDFKIKPNYYTYSYNDTLS